MKRLLFTALCLAAPFVALGQDDGVNLDGLLRSAERWAQENLDDDALRALQNVDQARVKQFLADLQKQFQGEYVLDLASLNDTAKAILPVLEKYEETLPYALWLKTRLDYLEVAGELRPKAPPVKPAPGQPPKPTPNPKPQLVREVWVKQVAQRPWPPAAKPYVASLKEIFTAQKVPAQLIWLAEVESSFDPRARSPAGAAGLFQLMPATAKRYGLRTTWPQDERLKPEVSATAAAKYLAYLHGHFKDWRLAIAAYNAGEGTVQTLLTRHKATTFDAIATHLPAETQMYVPKVEAVVLRREGVKLGQL